MPKYEYECQNCLDTFEIVQSMNDDKLKTCKKCNKDTLIRLISKPSIIFKGSGFYVNDYKKANK